MSWKNQGLKLLTLVILQLFLTSCGYLGGSGPPRKAPAAPQHVRVDQVPEGLHVDWQCTPGVDKYTLFWGTERGEYRGMINSDTCGLILAGLHKGELYYLAVTAWNIKGESGYSEEVAFVNEDDPKQAAACVSKGYELLNAGMYMDAQAYLSAAIRLDPNNPDAYRLRASLYEKAGQSDFAREDLQSAERLYKKKPWSKKGDST